MVELIFEDEKKINEPSFDKCTCEWSKDGSTIIADKDCPIHGPAARKVLSQPVSIGRSSSKKEGKPFLEKAKFWAVAGTIAIFAGVIIWRIIGKFT